MTGIGWGVTKEGPTYHIYIIYIYYLSHSCSSFPFMWGSLRLAPINIYDGSFEIRGRCRKRNRFDQFVVYIACLNHAPPAKLLLNQCLTILDSSRYILAFGTCTIPTILVNWSLHANRILSQVAGLSIRNTSSSPLSFLADAIASLMAKNTEAARKRGGSPTACIACL